MQHRIFDKIKEKEQVIDAELRYAQARESAIVCFMAAIVCFIIGGYLRVYQKPHDVLLFILGAVCFLIAAMFLRFSIPSKDTDIDQ